jgi:hypothetical protein
MIENILHNEQLISVIIRSQYNTEDIKFFTPDDFSQQLAYMNRKKGYVISPHVHNPVKREVSYTQEVLFIKSGKVRVDYFSDDKNYLESRILNQGDVVLLSGGGHGFYMLEDSEIIEVKQGPYAGDKDKTRFSPVEDDQVRLK